MKKCVCVEAGEARQLETRLLSRVVERGVRGERLLDSPVDELLSDLGVGKSPYLNYSAFKKKVHSLLCKVGITQLYCSRSGQMIFANYDQPDSRASSKSLLIGVASI